MGLLTVQNIALAILENAAPQIHSPYNGTCAFPGMCTIFHLPDMLTSPRSVHICFGTLKCEGSGHKALQETLHVGWATCIGCRDQEGDGKACGVGAQARFIYLRIQPVNCSSVMPYPYLYPCPDLRFRQPCFCGHHLRM